MVELADVAGGELSGFGARLINDRDADAVAVGDEGDFERRELAEVADGGIAPVDDERSGFVDPVAWKGARSFDEVAEGLGELGDLFFEVREALGGEFEAVFCAEKETVEEGLPCGVRGVSGDDVDDVFRNKKTGAGPGGEFFREPFLERFLIKGTSEGREKFCRLGDFGKR